MAKRRKRTDDHGWSTCIAEMGGFCWRCGRAPGYPPRWYHASFGIERAHVLTMRPRPTDRRAVIPLCSLCHKIEHGERFPQCEQTPLGKEVLIGMKKYFDAEHWAPDWLARFCVRQLPEPALLDELKGFAVYERLRTKVS